MLPSSLCLTAGVAGRIVALTGWRRAFVAMIAGVLAALAMPPVHALPLLLVAFPVLVWLIDGARTSRGALAAGWWWGFGHFSAGLYWIANALLVDPARFGWMIPFAIFGLAAVLGAFPALAALAARLVRPGVSRVLVLAAAWAACEWLRGTVFTGFPWNLVATVWMPVLPVIQLASVVGAYGLAVPTVAAFAMPAALVRRGGHPGLAVVATWVVLAAIAAWGYGRIPSGPTPTVPDVRLRLVQGNVAQANKWKSELRIRHLEEYVALSRGDDGDGLAAVIWPETAVSYFLDDDPSARAFVARAAPPGGVVITGAIRARLEDGRIDKLWNAIEVLTPRGEIIATYDKAHLVPFGEYVPFHEYLPILKITAGAVDFSPGPGPATLDLPGLPPVSPTICYEDIFPGRVTREDPRPSWLLNVTNDGWFGNSAGPYQHFAAARLRAVEEGLPLARAANTGITGFVDPYGRITARLPLGVRGVLDAELSVALSHATLYSRFGNWMVLFPIFLAIIVALFWRAPSLMIDGQRPASAFR